LLQNSPGQAHERITFDNRDMGLSQKFQIDDIAGELEKHREGKPYAFPYTLNDMSDDAIVVLDERKIESAHVVGASLGGLIGQIVACRHGDRVKSLSTLHTAIDINHWAGQGFVANIAYFTKILSSPSPTVDMPLDTFLENRLAVWEVLLTDAAHPTLSADERSLLLQEMTLDYQRGGVDFQDLGGMGQMLATCAWVDQHLSDHKAALSQLEAKRVLLLHGRLDMLLPAAAAEELKASIPNARLLFYEGGHNLPLDQHAYLTESILSNIRS
jgi:pimeloyl-ACP methyl ester carboxylesterase